MDKLYVNIADLNISVTGKIYDYVRYRLRDYICNPFECAMPEIFYEEKSKIDLPACNIITKKTFRVYGEDASYYINYDLLENETVTALMKIKKDFSKVYLYLCDVEDLGGASLEVRFFNMLGEVIKLAVIGYGGLALHSSSINCNGSGIVFSAPSGTGKSTHTRLWKKNFENTKIINDDMPILRCYNNIWHLCGSPWSGKTEININEKVPLKGIVFLSRGEQNEIRRAKMPDCIIKLLSQTLNPAYNAVAKRLMENVASLMKAVPVYELRCNISDEAPIVVAKELGIKCTNTKEVF